MSSNRRIDVHHHFYPPQYLDAMRQTMGRDKGGVQFPAVLNWTPAKTLDEMDKNGVQTAILSLSPPGPRMLDLEGNRRLARGCNEYGTQVQRDHPGRFGLFAPVPMPDVEGTLKEIEYALDTLKADGIQLMTSYGNKWIGDPAYDAVFDELHRRKALVYVHPLASPCSADLMEWVPDAVLEYPHDTSRAVCSMLFSGTLARCPDIRFIFSHSGGTIPFLSGRILHSGTNRLPLDRVPKGVDHELRKLNYDVALACFKPALAALFAYIPESQILLGSDYPFSSAALSIKGLEEYGFSKETLDAIYSGNIERLLPRLKG
jgi:predicted TIM-barrel fold metal-dependent hydrolase